MTLLKSTLLAAAGIVLVGTVAAQSAHEGKASLWVGTWQLDAANSHFTGDTVTYTEVAGGRYHFEDGSAGAYDFGTDGKEYPTPYGRTTSWTPVSDHAWDSVIKMNGAVLYKVHRDLSADGKTLTVTATGTNADGSPLNDSTVYHRVSDGQGLAGTWRDVKTSATAPPAFVISSLGDGTYRLAIPQWQASLETKLDGAEVTVRGPRIPAGSTYTGKLEGSRKISFELKFNGQADMFGEDTLASDGRSYTDLTWNPGKESEKSKAIYVKQ